MLGKRGTICWYGASQDSQDSSLGMNGNGADISPCFVSSFQMSKLAQQNLLKILEYYLTKISTFIHIYLRSAVHVFTSSRIYSVFAVTLDSAKLFANALVSSRLDNCNSLLSGIADTGLCKLQRVLNRLACSFTKSPSVTRSVPLLHFLHWLPVKYRVHFKICLLTYKAVHKEQCVYLLALPATSFLSRSLRSNKGITLSVPRIKTNTSARAFSSCSLWNSLPPSVHSATSQLLPSGDVSKHTYLFDLSFPT